ncbi:hypothetical protein Hanom_Chr16g01445841 [Helianthus anomalus]
MAESSWFTHLVDHLVYLMYNPLCIRYKSFCIKYNPLYTSGSVNDARIGEKMNFDFIPVHEYVTVVTQRLRAKSTSFKKMGLFIPGVKDQGTVGRNYGCEGMMIYRLSDEKCVGLGVGWSMDVMCSKLMDY